MLQSAGLLRKRSGVLRVSRAGRSLLAPEQAPALLARLFEATFWRTDLQAFDRVPLEFWPQHHMGIVLWWLSVTAYRWTSGHALMRACTLMQTLEDPVAPDSPELAFVVRVMRPLAWLGLIEREEDDEEHSSRAQLYRKTPLFDRLLGFDVAIMGTDGTRH